MEGEWEEDERGRRRRREFKSMLQEVNSCMLKAHMTRFMYSEISS